MQNREKKEKDKERRTRKRLRQDSDKVDREIRNLLSKGGSPSDLAQLSEDWDIGFR